MIFDTNSTQAAQASLDALWMKTQVITNNLANGDTPGYKQQNVSFSQVLNRAGDAQQRQQEMAARNEQGNQAGAATAAGRSRAGDGAVYRTRVTRSDDTSVRVDGNNVSLEQQQTELWKSYAQYSYLLDRLSGHYGSISTAIGNMRT